MSIRQTRPPSIRSSSLFSSFVYNPESLKVVLFPTRSTSSRTLEDGPRMDLDDASAGNPTPAHDDTSLPPTVFAHTKTETFVIFPQASAAEDADLLAGSSLRYTIAVIVHSHTQSGDSVAVVDHSIREAPAKTEAPKEPSPDGVADMSMSPSEAAGLAGPPEKAQTGAAEVGSGKDDAVIAKQAGEGDKSDHAAEKEARGPDSIDKLKPVGSAITVQDTMAPKKKSESSKLQVLQRDITAEQFIFELDGIGVVSNEVENGARKGWKMEVRSWRLAGADALPLMQTVM